LHSSKRDIEPVTSERLQEKLIESDLAVLQGTSSRDIWLQDEVGITIIGRAETGYANNTAKAFCYSPCCPNSPACPNRVCFTKPDTFKVVANKLVADPQFSIYA
jgi:hypothetical protein